MSILGKYWIFPNGTIHNVGAGEHAQIAKDDMLCLPRGTSANGPQLFFPLSTFKSKEAFERGAAGPALKWLEERGDPRIYAIDRWKWIRTRKEKFYCHDESGIAVVAKSVAFWNEQSGAEDIDTLEFILADGKKKLLTVGELVNHA